MINTEKKCLEMHTVEIEGDSVVRNLFQLKKHSQHKRKEK